MSNERYCYAAVTKKRTTVLLTVRRGEVGGKYPLSKTVMASRTHKLTHQQVAIRSTKIASDAINLCNVTKKPSNRLVSYNSVSDVADPDIFSKQDLIGSGSIFQVRIRLELDQIQFF